MSIAFIVITALVIIVSVLLVALILAQKKDAAGFTNGMGGMVSFKYLLGSESRKILLKVNLNFLQRLQLLYTLY